ncbi:antitoxin [Streptomyces sp. NPDC046197]|uniref:antitoxin n=1 Tax=Streptomyces sp. NPDC046197 TaxID=3154337 RepID=UPI0033C81427
MGLLHDMKVRLGPTMHRMSDLAQRQEVRIEHGLDRAAKLIDDKTKHKYSEKIQAGTGKTKHAMERLVHKEGAPDTGTGAAPGTATGTGTAPGTGTTPGGPAATPPQEPPTAS